MAQRPVLGIDLGTTYSCVAQVDEHGKPVALENSEGDYTTPSVVYFEDGGNAVVGKHAKNELGRQPDRVVQHIKRKMGVPDFFIEMDGRNYYPPQISSLILDSVVSDALAALGLEVPPEGPLADVVITVPAYFGGAERSATKTAGELARLNVLSIINEPTAAAIAYGLSGSPEQRTVLVYDLGGGTFDVTVVEASSEVIRAVATGGDRQLGGADWDAMLKDLILDRFREQCPDADPLSDAEAMGELDVKAEEVKQNLTRKTKYGLSFTAATARASFDLTRQEFEELTEDLVERTLRYTELVLDAAKAKGVDHLDEVILVGGMSRVPVISERLTERLRARFPNLPQPRLADPDQIVAKGAALFATSKVQEEYQPGDRDQGAKFLSGPAVPQIENITSRGYGVQAFRDERDEVGYVSWLIRPNDQLPAAPQERYSTLSANQTEVRIVVFESATNVLNDAVNVNTELVRGMLTGLPSGKPPGQPVDVTFRLGDEGILEITAVGPSGQNLRLEYKLPGEVPAEELEKPLPSIAKW
ncbi:MAG TPA: Hsp70 family protein [Pseudonocardiaceae bacterium]|jgi:molecular chaperone DnaK|nr:Hsp70 family protein [Pseudonocardiaceae bacterium]